MNKLQLWKESGRYFSYNGKRIFYIDSADNPARANPIEQNANPDRQVVFCLHGYPTSSWDWYLLWPTLSEKFRVITLDWLGFGFSDKPGQDYNIAQQADIAEALLSHLNITQTHLLAHDYGGTVAQELLARLDEDTNYRHSTADIKSVCFLNGGLFPETHRATFTQKIMVSPFGGLFLWLVPHGILKSRLCALFGPDSQPSEEQLEYLWSAITYNRGNKILHRLLHYIRDRIENRERWVGILQKTRVPLRLIDGAQDIVSGQHMAERYMELVPNPDVVLLKEIGHYPQLEAPTKTLQAYLTFMNA